MSCAGRKPCGSSVMLQIEAAKTAEADQHGDVMMLHRPRDEVVIAAQDDARAAGRHAAWCLRK